MSCQRLVGTPQPTLAPTRVQCEAPDCGALLEVNVPQDQSGQDPLVVRCGNCKRLLEVHIGAPTSHYGSYAPHGCPDMPVAGPQQPPTPPSAQSHVYDSGSGRRSVAPPQLITPPPLSRSFFRNTNSPRSGNLQYTPLSSPHYFEENDPFHHGSRGSALATHGLHPYSFGGMHSPNTSHLFPRTNMPNNYLGMRRHGQYWNSGHGQSQGNLGFNGQEASFGMPGLMNPDTDALMGTDTAQHKDGQQGKKKKRSRNPSPYNLFMSDEVKRLKEANPELDHREAFKMAASNWAKSPDKCRVSSGYTSRMSLLSKLVSSNAKSVKGVGNPPTKQNPVPCLEEGSGINPEAVEAAPGINRELPEEVGCEHRQVMAAEAGQSNSSPQLIEDAFAGGGVNLETLQRPPNTPLDGKEDLAKDEEGKEDLEMTSVGSVVEKSLGALEFMGIVSEKVSMCVDDQQPTDPLLLSSNERYGSMRAEVATRSLPSAAAPKLLQHGDGLRQATEEPKQPVRCLLEPVDNESIRVQFVVNMEPDTS